MNTQSADNKEARRLLSFIEEFRKLSPNIQAGQIVIFLHIASKPGISLKELERRTGLSSTAVSRNVLALSEWVKKDVPGHNLVETYDDLDDRRNKLVKLKVAGNRIYDTLLNLVRSE
ncbi:MarR family transcriptional regulator [Mesorhizobium loti]|nr:MarR family winged helix-turn-helix transcriptional regulator [Mesorhizobium loti]PLP55568.1 MarR family transcriptional regulator [Mesorhizobium loti]